MEKVSNPFQACSDIFVKPNRVFATLASTQNWSWLPFLIVVSMAILPSYLYFNFVDFNWYIQLIIDTSYANVSPAEQNAIRNNMSQGQMSVFATFGVFFGYLIINAVMATYLNIITKRDEECVQGFTDWYGFTWWISMPTVLGSLISLLILLLASDNQLSPVNIAPTTFAFIFDVEMSSPWFSLMQSIRIDSFWVMYLTSVGVSRWTNLSTNMSYIIAIAPYAVIWTVWALITVL
ncbi:MAG: hypothetical protein ACI88A_004966 [Paraglaciecola sp.]|jgi:hypothetical protein